MSDVHFPVSLLRHTEAELSQGGGGCHVPASEDEDVGELRALCLPSFAVPGAEEQRRVSELPSGAPGSDPARGLRECGRTGEPGQHWCPAVPRGLRERLGALPRL